MEKANDNYISMREIVLYLGVARETVLSWIAKRNMPAYKIGNLWNFKKSEVDAWIKTVARENKEYERAY